MLGAVVATAGALGVRGGTLTSHASRFAAHVTPWALVALVVGFTTARALLGPLRWSDLAVVVTFLAFEPVIEWLIHSWILHARPWQVLGRTFELSATKGHRLHHKDPTDLSLVFLPGFVLAVVAPALTVGLFLLAPAHLAATALATGAAALLAYEWTHYLIHTTYKPRHRYYRHLWRHHHLHHYRNEGYWYGVTTAMGDVLLGTCPRGGAVPVSPTARTLGKPLS